MRCDKKGSTITLYQIENGDCIGGFTQAEWSSPANSETKSDDSAMIFNLTRKRCYPCKDPKNAIRSWKYRGPEFGISELSIVANEQFNERNMGLSQAE